MTSDQVLISIILLATVGMFLWGRWRHDMVAAGSLLACVGTGLIPSHEAFAGFGHPAVITVACVLVLSRGLQTSGAVEVLTRAVLPAKGGTTRSLASLVGLGAVMSGFMNNVGAMAMLMPVAIQLAKRLNLMPGQVLMPLAFGTILGGMTTLVGTPPNLIVSGFRAETGASSFAMFDFTPVGLAVAVAGVAFVVLLGWRLVPVRKQSGIEGFESGAYITEARVAEDSKSVGMSLGEIEAILEDDEAQIIGMVHRDIRLTAPGAWRKVRAGDILVVEADADALSGVLSSLGLKLEEAIEPSDEEKPVGGTAGAEGDREADGEDEEGRAQGDAVEDETATTGEIVLTELVVMPGAAVVGRSASDLLLRTRYGMNLLALSRQGERLMKRLRSVTLESGDLLLMQGPPESIATFAADNGCVPLAGRELRIPDPRKALVAGIIMAVAVGVAAFGLLPAMISFAGGVLASMALRTVPPRGVYAAIDGSVVVLLGSLIPVAGAMQSTGTADLIAHLLLQNVAQGHAVVALTLIMVLSMCLSDLMNNAATAAVMCPIAIGTAGALDANAASFLMAVAIGASCAFLTPIGHQNNTLILGPGGFRFGDYWRLGVPLEILVVAISIPLLLVVWPL